MRQVSNATIQKYKDLLTTRLFTDADMVYFRSMLNNGLRNDPEKLAAYIEAFNEHGVSLVSDAQNKGITWLRKSQLKANGTLRASAFIANRELHILNNVVSVKVESLRNIGRGIWPQYVPVYRVESADQYFCYCQTATGDYEVV